jgi:hypothetical protein
MPLVFCELALAYPPAKVSDPAERIAAANGQFLLVEREAYRRLGGHAASRTKVLEDVELAFLAKRRKVGLRFRYAEDAVSTRMYRSTAAMIEGWTKNLALLFDNCLALAVWRVIDILLLVWLPVLASSCGTRASSLIRRKWLGAGWVLALLVGAQPLPLLWPRGQIQLFLPRLRPLAAGIAAVCGAALSQLVSASHPEARKLEGQELRGLKQLKGAMAALSTHEALADQASSSSQ